MHRLLARWTVAPPPVASLDISTRTSFALLSPIHILSRLRNNSTIS